MRFGLDQSLVYSISEVCKSSWSVAFSSPQHTQASLAAHSQSASQHNHFPTFETQSNNCGPPATIHTLQHYSDALRQFSYKHTCLFAQSKYFYIKYKKTLGVISNGATLLLDTINYLQFMMQIQVVILGLRHCSCDHYSMTCIDL